MASRFGAELILILFCLFTTLGVIITYITAVQRGDVYPGLPYISDTGSYPPESCIFTFVLCSGAIIAYVIVWIRYRHVKAHYADSPARVQWLNIFSFFSGFISMCGLILVGSFQNVNEPHVHFIGAFLIFIGGVAYSLLQTILSYRVRNVHPEHVGCCVLALRVLTCCLLVFFVVSAICTGVSASYYYRNRQAHRVYWGPSDGGYILHSFSACSEWLAAFSYMLFFLTFHPDFERIHVDLHIRLRRHHGDSNGPIVNEYSPIIR